jgi:hypothetical protein
MESMTPNDLIPSTGADTHTVPLRLWLLTQTTCDGYDTYDSCVVAAPDADTARLIRPDERAWSHRTNYPEWPFKPGDITVRLIGTADPSVEAGVVLASFNAG